MIPPLYEVKNIPLKTRFFDLYWTSMMSWLSPFLLSRVLYGALKIPKCSHTSHFRYFFLLKSLHDTTRHLYTMLQWCTNNCDYHWGGAQLCCHLVNISRLNTPDCAPSRWWPTMYMQNRHVHHLINTKLHCAPLKCTLVQNNMWTLICMYVVNHRMTTFCVHALGNHQKMKHVAGEPYF